MVQEADPEGGNVANTLIRSVLAPGLYNFSILNPPSPPPHPPYTYGLNPRSTIAEYCTSVVYQRQLVTVNCSCDHVIKWSPCYPVYIRPSPPPSNPPTASAYPYPVTPGSCPQITSRTSSPTPTPPGHTGPQTRAPTRQHNLLPAHGRVTSGLVAAKRGRRRQVGVVTRP